MITVYLYVGVKYDTGAQYYSLKPIMNDVHSRWSNAGMVSPWFSDAKGDYCVESKLILIL